MSFHASAQNIRLEDDHILVADLLNEDEEYVEARFDLNEILGNSDGHFEWEGAGFGGSASDISLDLEGDESVPVLRATLDNAEGEPVEANVNLAERLGNNNGSFDFS
ncbi:hypothetical protein ASPVEDRAFT_39102 [Aspergillus versicolor CBS 583.65]|uniref:Cyanovirin-N domain-containing protein n=1 Tax=Aspergillus versicolor CBS 583.65 TaxID=1036611 RepID=A0A1L9PE42_ASPVE|nr:uncharacterized protein ASPVEDRAFT_39102 [Aspergillus versicolor CBS 583.65]OJI99725.1 hypothetical protein ASPVEDRAFT_39102 [Aspergillus versicolor CBS 583.65]